MRFVYDRLTVRDAAIIGITITVAIIVAVVVSTWPPVREGVITEEQSRVFKMREIWMHLTVPPILSDLTYEKKTVQRLGVVLVMQAASILDTDTGKGCELGVMYTVLKNRLEAAGISEAWLRERTEARSGMPPQVKEFQDMFFVFEPSHTVCTKGSQLAGGEVGKRSALWTAVPTAWRGR